MTEPTRTTAEKEPMAGSARHVSGLSPRERLRRLHPRSAARQVERRRARAIRARRRSLTAGMATTALLLSGGMAFAYVTSSGSGAGTARVIAPQVTASVGTVAGQYPGAAPTTLPVVVRNDGAAPFTLTGVVPATDGFPATCPASAWSLGPPDPLPTVPPTTSMTVPVTASLHTDAPNSCQGATLSVPVTVTGTIG